MTSQSSIPRFVVSGLLFPLSGTLKTQTGYDVLSTSPKSIVKLLDVPAYFMVSDKDTISPPNKLKKMFQKYGKHVEKNGSKVEKVFRLFEGEHNSMRHYNLLQETSKWLKKFYESSYQKDFDEQLSDTPKKSVKSRMSTRLAERKSLRSS